MKKNELVQSPVVFDKEAHTYDLNGRELKGVTPIVKWLFPETYSDIPEDVLMRAAERGTLVHSQCELADRMGIAESDEAKAYVHLMKEMGLAVIANEYTVSDEKSIASQIDLVCEDVSIGDIKATSSIHIPNVTVQLSIYAYLFERQNKGAKVENLFVVWLPRKQYGQPCIKLLQRIDDEKIGAILYDYLAGESNERARGLLGFAADSDMPTIINDTYKEMLTIKQRMDELKKREDELKMMWLLAMQESGNRKAGNEYVTVTRKDAGVRTSIDSKKLQADYPDVYAKCVKESKVNESILIKFL